MTAIARIISVAGLIALAGCGGPTFHFNGTYVGVGPYKVTPGQDYVVAKQLATVKLIVNPDGTAELSDAGVPIKGHIDFGVHDATFVPDSIVGTSMDQMKPEFVKMYTIKLAPKGSGDLMYNGTLLLKRRPDSTSP